MSFDRVSPTRSVVECEEVGLCFLCKSKCGVKRKEEEEEEEEEVCTH